MQETRALRIVGALPLLWGLGNLSGPLLSLCLFGRFLQHPPPSVYGAAGLWLRLVQTLTGLALALACVWVGQLVLRGVADGRRLLGALLRVVVVYNIVVVVVPAIPEVLLRGNPALVLAYKGSQAGLTVLRGIGELVAALSLLWYLAELERAGDEGSPVPGSAARLAAGILLAREGAQLLAAPSSVQFLTMALQSRPVPALHLVTLALSPVAGLAALVTVVDALVLRRARPTVAMVALLTAALCRTCTLIRPWPDAHAGGATWVLLAGGTLVSGLAILTEYGVLAHLLGQGAEQSAPEAPNEV